VEGNDRMSACPQCGTVAKPSDKFCNTCGTPVVARGASAQQPAAYGGAPQAAAGPYGGGGYGGGGGGQPPYGAPSRCQMGHDIAPGQSYCAQGHPMALDAMQFPNDAYGAPPQQPPQQGGYGGQYAPPPQAPQYAPPAQQQQQGYGAQPPAAAPYSPPGQAQGGFPPPQPPPNMYGPGQGGFGGAAPAPAFEPAPAAAPAAVPVAASSAPMVLPANALRGFLVTYQANTKGDFWPLNGGRVTIGRSSSGDQVDIPLADATISSRHAMIVVDGTTGSVSVEDTGSTNGTYVNEEHLGFNGRRELRDGDRVRFGGFTTIVKLIGRV